MAPGRPRSSLDRRQALALLSRAGAVLVVGCGTAPEGPGCTLAQELTAGPYWLDAQLERSDLRWDTHQVATPNPRPGVPLVLEAHVVTSADEGCHPVPGAQVDLWQCDAWGLYSDESQSGTRGQDFLRGYQLTDRAGQVTFSTIYPGWYPGRTVHIHVRVRLFDPFSHPITDVSTQLFFDDAVTDLVSAKAPYASRGPRDTRNAVDPLYRQGESMQVELSGTPANGYRGSVVLGVRIGEIRTG